MKIAVLGGGCVGLTTGIQLQEELRNAHIDIIATDFEQTTSHVAAGIFRVSSSYCGPNDAMTRKWIKDSYNFYDLISRSEESAEAGIAGISGYIFSNSRDNTKQDWMEDVVPLYRQATESELQLVGGNWKYGTFMRTLVTQPNLYLPWARKKLANTGVGLIEKSIGSLNNLTKDYDVIMNCTGLGAKVLCKDRKMVPIKGQVIKVRAPWLKTFFYGEVNTYIIPGTDGLTTLGGCRDFESSDLNICPYQSAAIRDRCEKLLPSLKKAETVMHKVGLRPHREGGVRVEAEFLKEGPYKALVIHNYGHGGYGICTAPGTSKYAVELAIDAHKSSAKL